MIFLDFSYEKPLGNKNVRTSASPHNINLSITNVTVTDIWCLQH